MHILNKALSKKGIALVGASLLIFYLMLYFLGYWSVPYELIHKHIETNETIAHEIGELQNYYISFWRGYYTSEHGDKGSARYKIIILGSRKKGQLYVQLLKERGIWRIIKSQLILKDESIEIIKLG